MRSSADPPAAPLERSVERSQAHFEALVDAPDERAVEPGRGGGARDRAKRERPREGPDRDALLRLLAERRARDEDEGGGGEDAEAAVVLEDTPETCVCTLGPNTAGATHAALSADGIGALYGPGLDIGLWDGVRRASGDWIARAGAGTLYGRQVRLRPNASGAVLVVWAGADGTPEMVTARLGTMELCAAVTGVR